MECDNDETFAEFVKTAFFALFLPVRTVELKSFTDSPVNTRYDKVFETKLDLNFQEVH